jgi:hypothetical protein
MSNFLRKPDKISGAAHINGDDLMEANVSISIPSAWVFYWNIIDMSYNRKISNLGDYINDDFNTQLFN